MVTKVDDVNEKAEKEPVQAEDSDEGDEDVVDAAGM